MTNLSNRTVHHTNSSLDLKILELDYEFEVVVEDIGKCSRTLWNRARIFNFGGKSCLSFVSKFIIRYRQIASYPSPQC